MLFQLESMEPKGVKCDVIIGVQQGRICSVTVGEGGVKIAKKA